MFKFIFDCVTDVFGKITGNEVYDWFLVLIISQILFLPAYGIVGRMYNEDISPAPITVWVNAETKITAIWIIKMLGAVILSAYFLHAS